MFRYLVYMASACVVYVIIFTRTTRLRRRGDVFMKHRAQKKIKTPKLKPGQMVLRCFAEQKGTVWQAFCLDLNLAVQGDSRYEVKAKLQSQIAEYLHDALAGEDRQYADQLLTRRAPASTWIRYYCLKAISQVINAHNGIREFFNEVMPLTVKYHHA